MSAPLDLSKIVKVGGVGTVTNPPPADSVPPTPATPPVSGEET